MKSFFVALPAAVLGSVLSLTLVGQAQPAKTPSAVAYVSATRILTESTYGRSEATRLQTMQQQRTTDLRAKSQALEATRQQLATTVDAAARPALQQKEQQQRVELERGTAQFTTDFQALQREINGEMQRRVRAVLEELMKTQSYQLVLNQDTAVMWAMPENDVTSAVVGRMNAQ